LDCYNAELNIAIEYNGQQHYNYTPHFHKSKDEFIKQQYRDEMKKMKCKEKGIILIIVPHTIKIKDIEKYIKKELTEYGYLV
jgi:hypothetical protein